MKKLMVKILALMVAVSTIFCFVGCEKEEFYELSCGITIMLEGGFKEVQVENTTCALESQNVLFTALKEPYTNFGESVNVNTFSTYDYANAIISANGFVGAQPQNGSSGVTYFEFVQDGYYNYITCHKSGSDYWCCRFMCVEANKDNYAEKFANWSSTILFM